MRRVRYMVASSLDGYIAGPQGEADWIVMDPEIDFEALYGECDTILMGRRTFETTGGRDVGMPGMETFVFSTTLAQSDYRKVTIVSENAEGTVRALRTKPGKDIWLFGGGILFRTLLAAGLVDSIELGVMPVLLGGGIPLLPVPARRASLTLVGHKVYGSGTVALQYAVKYPKTASRKKADKRPAD